MFGLKNMQYRIWKYSKQFMKLLSFLDRVQGHTKIMVELIQDFDLENMCMQHESNQNIFGRSYHSILQTVSA